MIQALQAPNILENASIQQATALAGYLAALGIPFDLLYVQQANGSSSPDETYPVSALQAMGINQQTPLYIFGKVGATSYNIALEMQLIAGVDGENSYVKLYAERNPGATAGQAMAALTQVPAVNTPLLAVLNGMKAAAGLS